MTNSREPDGDMRSPRPLISVVMANYRGEAYLEQAVMSVLQQSVSDLELIISDDASPDRSVEIARGLMAKDGRIRVLTSDTNQGPARARNNALAVARGQWIAVVDSDDLLHPNRFERLLAAAEYYDAAIVADDLLHFEDSDSTAVSYLLNGQKFAKPFLITAQNFLGGRDQDIPPFGYLKPMFRSAILKGVRYDEALKIGEDYELVLRLLLEGATYVVVPEPFYLYRRHPNSISYRLSEAAVRAMIASQKKLRSKYGPFDDDVAKAFDGQMVSLSRALAFEQLVAALKAKRLLAAGILCIKQPRLIDALLGVVRDRISRSSDPREEQSSEAQTAVTILFADEQTEPFQMAEAKSFAEQHSSQLIVEKAPRLKKPAEAWAESQEQQKERWKRLAAFGNKNIVALLYSGPAGQFDSGFIPVPGKRHRLQNTEILQP
ncbi:glycosyltransferase family 2 protein [Rhizobium sp. KDH_Rht_773_N]